MIIKYSLTQIALLAIFATACTDPKNTESPVLGVSGTPVITWEPTDHPYYTSKVPKFSFATTLEEQEEQLKTNPLMERFRKSRQEEASHPHYPFYHFVAPESTLNDPNGFSFWNGKWHLFYQAFPPDDPRPHWGHVISDDLIHWRDLPYAIYPDPEQGSWSGSAIVEEDRVIAMYHGHMVGNMVAVSNDPLLLNWEKVTGKPVVPYTERSADLPYDVYDPNIFKKDGMYYSLSGGVQEGPGDKQVLAAYLFRSKDLSNWEYLHQFIEDDRFTLVGDDAACPYFWPIGNQHMVIFYSHMSGGQYLLGDFDKKRDKFLTTGGGKFNFGASNPSGVHAPSATPDGEGGLLVIFNMNPGKYHGIFGGESETEGFTGWVTGWKQIMTLPRRLILINNETLGIEPAGDIESLRYDYQQVQSMALPANKEVVLENIKGNAMEFIAEIDPKNAPMVEINVLRSPNREEFTRIAFFKERGMHQGRNYTRPRPENWRKSTNKSIITLESSYSSLLPDALSRPPESAPVQLDPDETLKLRVFIDRSVVEVFVNGKQCLAVRVYPSLEESVGVSLRSQGQESELIAFDAWQMKSIYAE